MTTGLAPLSEVLEELDMELRFRQDDSKSCSWRTHEAPAKAVSEVVCLACGRFCGYACAEHEKKVIDVMNSGAAKVRCRFCNSNNLFSFLPL